MDAKREPKIEVWALRGPTFEVLGRILRSLIFYEFSIGEKSASNHQRWRHGAANGRHGANFVEGRHWQESAESVSNALLPARGAADIKAKASCRRPPKYMKTQKYKKCKNENRQKLIILEGFRQNGYHH